MTLLCLISFSKVDVPSQSPAVMRVIATRGNRRVVGLTSQSAHHRSPPRPLRPSAPLSSALSLTTDGGSGVAGGLEMRDGRPTRVQSSLELRDLIFQEWCAKRGKQYLEKRRSEHLKRMQVEEEMKRQVNSELLPYETYLSNAGSIWFRSCHLSQVI